MIVQVRILQTIVSISVPNFQKFILVEKNSFQTLDGGSFTWHHLLGPKE
jgi:hypothetical protein